MTSLVLMDTALQRQRRLINALGGAVGLSTQRVLWTPGPTEGLTTVDGFVPSRVWTHGNAIASRLARQGNGYSLSFNGTTDYLTAPDATDLSFGNGATDTPFSIIAVAKVTDTAGFRDLFTKSAAAAQEYALYIDSADQMNLALIDQSVPAGPFRASNAAISQGSWAVFGATYSAATGGATAANDITLYQNGAVIASTATNVGTYVAMENLTSAAEIGSQSVHSVNFYQGLLACVMVVQKNLLAADHLLIKQQLAAYFGLGI